MMHYIVSIRATKPRTTTERHNMFTKWTTDTVLDAAAEIIDTAAKARRRDAAQSRAHAQGHTACEICGRALKTGPAIVIDGCHIGPTCLKKLKKM